MSLSSETYYWERSSAGERRDLKCPSAFVRGREGVVERADPPSAQGTDPSSPDHRSPVFSSEDRAVFSGRKVPSFCSYKSDQGAPNDCFPK